MCFHCVRGPEETQTEGDRMGMRRDFDRMTEKKRDRIKGKYGDKSVKERRGRRRRRKAMDADCNEEMTDGVRGWGNIEKENLRRDYKER